MGDYIDRGKKSKQVVDKVIDMQNYCNCVYLIGSHEYAMMHAKSDDYYDYLFWNYGGDATAESYGGFDNIMKVHGDFFRSLKYYHIIENYLFVHAGIRSEYSLEEQDEVDMVYIRSNFYNREHNLPYKIIFGHTEFEKPQVWSDKICIDTGCGKYKDAPLTAIVIVDDKYNFVDSNGRKYCL
jgi:serine/threonine protein phosphatase 1